jgi:hypothetical protein
MSFIEKVSDDCPFLDIVTSDVNNIRKEEYPKVNAACVDSR